MSELRKHVSECEASAVENLEAEVHKSESYLFEPTYEEEVITEDNVGDKLTLEESSSLNTTTYR